MEKNLRNFNELSTKGKFNIIFATLIGLGIGGILGIIAYYQQWLG